VTHVYQIWWEIWGPFPENFVGPKTSKSWHNLRQLGDLIRNNIQNTTVTWSESSLLTFLFVTYLLRCVLIVLGLSCNWYCCGSVVSDSFRLRRYHQPSLQSRAEPLGWNRVSVSEWKSIIQRWTWYEYHVLGFDRHSTAQTGTMSSFTLSSFSVRISRRIGAIVCWEYEEFWRDLQGRDQ